MITPDDVMSYINLAKTVHKGYNSAVLAREEKVRVMGVMKKVEENTMSTFNLHDEHANRAVVSRVDTFKREWEGREEQLEKLIRSDIPSDEDVDAMNENILTSSSKGVLVVTTQIINPEIFCGLGGGPSASSESKSASSETENAVDAEPTLGIKAVEPKDLVVLRFLKRQAALEATLNKCASIFVAFDKAYPPSVETPAPQTAQAPAPAPEAVPEPAAQEHERHPPPPPQHEHADPLVGPDENGEHAPGGHAKGKPPSSSETGEPHPENVGGEESAEGETVAGDADSDGWVLEPDVEVVAEGAVAAVETIVEGKGGEYAEDASEILSARPMDLSIPIPAAIAGVGDMLNFFLSGCETPFHSAFEGIQVELKESEKDWHEAYKLLADRVEKDTSDTMSKNEVDEAMKRHEEGKLATQEIGAKMDEVLAILTLSDAEIKLKRVNASGEKLFFAVRDAVDQKSDKKVRELCGLFAGETPIFQWTLSVDKRKLSALGYAAQRGAVSCVQCLLEASAPVDFGGGDSTPLMLAAAVDTQDHVKVIELLTLHGAEVNRASGAGTALHVAIKSRSVGNFKCLVAKGADINAAAGECNWTPLYVAMRNIFVLYRTLSRDQETKAMAIVEGLLDAQATLEPEWLYEAVDMWPSSTASPEATAQLLTKILTHPNYADQRLHSVHIDRLNKGTLLYAAVDVAFTQGVAALAGAGARVSLEPGVPKSAPLFLAVVKATKTVDQGVALVSALLKSEDLNLGCRDYQGRTVIVLAVLARKTAVLKKLLLDQKVASASPAIIDLPDLVGRTAVHHAVLTNQGDALDALISANADLNCRDHEGKTAAFYATELGFFARLQQLVRTPTCDVQGAGGPNPVEFIKAKVKEEFEDPETHEFEPVDGIDTVSEAADQEERTLQIHDLLLTKAHGVVFVTDKIEVVGAGKGGCACVPRKK